MPYELLILDQANGGHELPSLLGGGSRDEVRRVTAERHRPARSNLSPAIPARRDDVPPGGDWFRIYMTSESATSMLRHARKRRPAACMATTLLITANSTPSWATADDHAALVERCIVTAWAFMQDIVPNHMAIIAADNAWWNDVLENGPISPAHNTSTSTGIPSSPNLRTSCCCRCLAVSTARFWRRGKCKWSIGTGRFSAVYEAAAAAGSAARIAHPRPRLDRL